MTNDTQRIVNKAWNFAHLLRDDGLSCMAFQANKQGAGRFCKIGFPLPPSKEQAAIVGEVLERLRAKRTAGNGTPSVRKRRAKK